MRIEYCYKDGNLNSALRQAAEFVEHIGEQQVSHVIARQDNNGSDAWWVDVIYDETDNG